MAGSDALDPIRSPRDWDVIIAAGVVSPGICKVSGFKRSFGWDVKKGTGVKGSTVTLSGYPPAEGTVTFSFWEPEHFEEWREFRELWNYNSTKKTVSAVDVFHPVLADLDIKSVVCKGIGAIEPAGKGMFQATIELIEYNPPPKKAAVATPTESRTFERHIEQGGTAADTAEDWLSKLTNQSREP